MLKSFEKRVRAIALLGVVAALALAGVATAQSGPSGSTGPESGQGHHAGRHGGPPPLGPGMKGLTYAQFHVQNKEGEAQVIRLDEGKVTAVDSSSITVEENDGSKVTVALGEDTKVVAKPGAETTVGDLSTGELVAVSGPEGEAAKVVMVLPKKGEAHQGKEGRQGPPRGHHRGPQGGPGPQGSGGPQGPGGPQGSEGPQGEA